MKCISISVYRNAEGYDCTNGGISSIYKDILIPHEEGWISVDENNPPENLCKVVYRELWGKTYLHIEPWKGPEHLGWMFGGNYAATSDSRFHEISEYPLPIHDRQETQKMYDLLSND